MARFLLIGLAGAVGTVARYQVGVWASRALGTTLPFGTLVVNVTGCFLIALIAEIAASTALVPPTLRLTLMTGLMGGLTTYSSFNYETTQFFQDRAWVSGMLNFGLTVVACFAAGLAGSAIARRLAAVV
jgi:CrcB protein